MTGGLKFEIQSFSTLEEHGTKADGTPDIRCNCGYEIRVVINGERILFEEKLQRNAIPVRPAEYLANRAAKILATYLPQIEPE